MTEEQTQPTDAEIIFEYKQRRLREAESRNSATTERRDASLPKSSSEGRLRDQQGNYISYSEAKRQYDQRLGKSKGWDTPDNTEHNIDVPKLNEGLPKLSYDEMREAFFARMGRKDPLVAKKLMDLKNQQRRSQYE